jgi:hypothetical protein
LWNSAESPAGDIFDKMVARIRVACCYMLCDTQLSAALRRQRANVVPIKQNVAYEPKRGLYLLSGKCQINFFNKIWAARRISRLRSAC